MLTTLLETPLGTMRAASDGASLTGLWFLGQKHYPTGTDAWTHRDDLPLFRKVADALAVYFRTGDIMDLPLAPSGTTFQTDVWTRLRDIQRGHTRTYAAIAGDAGKPQAARAAGAAVGRNPISIFIPCHRVVGSGGALTGYAGGLERKRALLALEGANKSVTD